MQTKPFLKINPRYAGDRGRTRLPSLLSHHTFSFGNYLDPEHVGYRSLRVINEDRLAPGKSSSEQCNHSMEILSMVMSGTLRHEDGHGYDGQLEAGDFQLMSTGRGISHRESNPSRGITAHYLQIWIQPNESGGDPRYVEFDIETRRVKDGIALLASPDGQFNSALIRQDAEVFFGELSAGTEIEIPLAHLYPYSWIQMLSGEVEIAATRLGAGDGAAIEASNFSVKAIDAAEFLLIRLP